MPNDMSSLGGFSPSDPTFSLQPPSSSTGPDVVTFHKAASGILGNGTDNIVPITEENIEEYGSKFIKFTGSPEALKQFNLDNLDPANPTLPVMGQYLNLMEAALQKGDLKAAIGISAAAAEASKSLTGPQTSSTSAATGASSPTPAIASQKSAGVGGNKWLAGNAFTSILVNYWELLKTMAEMKSVESNIEIAGRQMFMELAKSVSETILKAATTKAISEFTQAALDAVGATVTAVSAVASTGVSLGKLKGTPDNASPQQMATIKAQNEQWTAVSQSISSLGQAGSGYTKASGGIIRGITELEVGKLDSLKEMLQSYKQMQQVLFEKSSEAFKSETDMIAQIIQNLQQIERNIHEAIVAMYKKGG